MKFRHRFVPGGIRLYFQQSGAMTVSFNESKATVAEGFSIDGPASRFSAVIAAELAIEVISAENLEIDQGPE